MNKNFRPNKNPSFSSGQLKIIPLGGVGDVTKNMYVYEYGNDIVIVDCGLGFPDEAMPGIDLVIPDISYLKDKKDKIRGLVITHAHDDHIGGIPYLWKDLGFPPIYAQKLAVAFINNKLTEFRLSKKGVNVVGVDSRLSLGVFNISFYQVSHSVPDAVGIAIETPGGRVIHQADFKVDWTPVSGQVIEVGKLAMFGQKGVSLMLIDALRVEKSGYTLSEKTIQPTFTRIEAETKGKLIITTTSSNIGRIQQAINVAVASGRKVALIGRSMESNFQAAWDIGYLSVPSNIIIAPEEVKRFPENKLMLIVAGSQGQPGSSLSRIANSDHKQVSVSARDSVVFSADPIPSTEAAQHALIDKLTKLGITVYYTEITDDLHVSGHASAEEIKLMINLAMPKYLLPIGATFRHMKAFSKMAQEMGYGEDKILLVEDGKVINLSGDKVKVDGFVEAKNVYVDGLGVGDVGNVILRDRKVMAEEGVVLVIVPVDERTSKLAGDPDIVTRGFVFEKGAEEMLEHAKNIVKNSVADHPDAKLDWRFLRRHIEESLDKFFYEETKRSPLILPVIVEV